jgi:Fe-S-cluster formation regulator IscX/YfhJ
LIKDRTQVDPKEKAAYEKREKIKQEKEFEDKKNKRKNKFTNAIRGLVLDEDND